MKLLDVFDKFQTDTPFVRALNGKKTLLGVLSLGLYALDLAPLVFPQIPAGLGSAVQSVLLSVGVVLTPVGVLGKVAKLKREDGREGEDQ